MRHVRCHAIDGGFTDSVRDIITIAFTRWGRDMDNQAGLLLEHSSGGIATGDVMGADTNREHGVPKRGRKLPEGAVKAVILIALLRLISGPGIIDEQIESAVRRVNRVEYGAHLCVIVMITAHGNAEPSSLCHQRCGLVNRSRQGHGGVVGMFRASGHVDGGTGGTERLGDALSNPATGSGHERNTSV